MSENQRKFTVTPDDEGMRVDIVAALRLGVSRSSLIPVFSAGLVLLNGEIVKPRTILHEGDEVSLDIIAPKHVDRAAPDIAILYEDADLAIVEKPAGLSVHSTEHGNQESTIADFSATISSDNEDPDRPGIVHRLDKDTSGLLVIAKTTAAKQYMQQKFRNREVDKKYLALVRGRLAQPEATINLPIGRDRKRPTRRTVLPGGRPAVTHYKVLAEYPGASLVEVRLESGRTHQIRVHFAHLGHPVVGDELYGAAQPGLSRQFLHAAYLHFTGPDGRQVNVASTLPHELRDYILTLGTLPEGV